MNIIQMTKDDLREFAMKIVNEVRELDAEKREEEERNKRNAMLSTDEACRLLNVSRTTLWRLGRDGVLKGKKVRGSLRYSIQDLSALRGFDFLTKLENIKNR